MKQIRMGVFETNSSSTHSITISDEQTDALMDTLPMNESNEVVLTGGEFGWEEESYNDALTKANYLAVYIEQWAGDDSDRLKEMFERIIKEQTGCTEIVYGRVSRWGDSDPDLGYIDHQSVEGYALHWLFESGDDLRNFIFNPESILVTDNDNH